MDVKGVISVNLSVTFHAGFSPADWNEKKDTFRSKDAAFDIISLVVHLKVGLCSDTANNTTFPDLSGIV